LIQTRTAWLAVGAKSGARSASKVRRRVLETEELSAAGGALLLVAFFSLSLIIIAVMLWVFAQLTGWGRLARRFPYAGSTGESAAGGVILGSLGWNGPPLRIGLDATGVVLRPVGPFALAFGTVRIPWTAIVFARQREYQFFTVLEVRFGRGGSAVIGFLPSPAARAIAERVDVAAFVANCE
jgi:hypothetical protein